MYVLHLIVQSPVGILGETVNKVMVQVSGLVTGFATRGQHQKKGGKQERFHGANNFGQSYFFSGLIFSFPIPLRMTMIRVFSDQSYGSGRFQNLIDRIADVVYSYYPK